MIRALALGEVRTRDAARIVLKELSTGILLGLLLGGIAFGRALLWGVTTDLATCVGLTVLIVCTWANIVGALIPVAAEAVGIDHGGVSAVDHDLGRRVGPLHLPERGQAAHCAASRGLVSASSTIAPDASSAAFKRRAWWG